MSSASDIMQADQIQQREKEDPHDVDKVPIKTKDLNMRMVLRCESAFAGIVD
jgi:hypothetical protein